MAETDPQLQLAGFGLAFLSLLMTAIFPIFGKIERVKSTNINPLIYNVYFQCGVISLCIIVTVIVEIVDDKPIRFSYMGLISGILLGIGGWFVWLSLSYMGLTHTSAICSGIASVTGFIEGTLIGNIPDHWTLSVFALLLIVTGILGIGFNESFTTFIMEKILCQSASDSHLVHISASLQELNDKNQALPNRASMLFRLSSNHTNNDYLHHISASNQIQNDTEHAPLYQHATSCQTPTTERDQHSDRHSIDTADVQQIKSKTHQLRLIGLVFAFLGGICFGSMAFPEEFTLNNTTEAHYLPSFGVGALLMVIVDCAVLSFTTNRDEQIWHFSAAFIPGMISGMIWCIGFLAILYAEMLIDYSLAIPIQQCSICVAVLIGIFGFKEVTDTRAIIITMSCVCVVLAGVFLLPLGIE